MNFYCLLQCRIKRIQCYDRPTYKYSQNVITLRGFRSEARNFITDMSPSAARKLNHAMADLSRNNTKPLVKTGSDEEPKNTNYCTRNEAKKKFLFVWSHDNNRTSEREKFVSCSSRSIYASLQFGGCSILKSWKKQRKSAVYDIRPFTFLGKTGCINCRHHISTHLN